MNPARAQTIASFDWQWKNLGDSPTQAEGAYFRKNAIRLLLGDTGLPRSWFKGKKILDAGCGMGRWSWAMLKLGARVTAIDSSQAGCVRTVRNCEPYLSRLTVRKEDILRLSRGAGRDYDLVFSWGVLHHTGDIRKSFANLARLVKPGGRMFVYLYGKNTAAIDVKYDVQRAILSVLPFRFKAEILKRIKPGEGHEYFDGYSPLIAGKVAGIEVVEMFLDNGFHPPVFTRKGIDHYAIGRKLR